MVNKVNFNQSCLEEMYSYVDHQSLDKLSQGGDKKAYFGLKNSVLFLHIH